MTERLTKQTALVTGSSSGIGRGVAEAFAKEGANVAVNYPHDDQQANAEEVVAAIEAMGRQAIAVRADVSDEHAIQSMVGMVEEQLGPIDILVNNAGIATASPVEEMPVADWDRLFAVHVRGTFLATRAVLSGMYERDYGKIISTASQLAYKGAPAFAHYTACKGAVISFTRSLALEIGARNVNANAVAPGATLTPILDDVPADVLEAIRQGIPKGRLAEVEDIVPSYVFLASEDARHIQGQVISPNGGDVFL